MSSVLIITICTLCIFAFYLQEVFLIWSFLGSASLWILGNPLPACTYAAIRIAFPCAKEEEFTGFDLGEEED